MCAVLVVAVCALGFVAASASAVTIPSNYFKVKDQQGANDQPSQVDLTQMGRDESDLNTYKLFWSWDSTDDWTGGGQTGDACALFDSDGDGNINTVVCVRVSNPTTAPSTVTQNAGSPYLFSCSDARTDRCSQPNGPLPFTSTDIKTGALSATGPVSGANLITDTDPFANLLPDQNWPNDSTIEVWINKLVLPANSVLVNVCSYPSAGAGGNNAPFDCIVSPGGGLLLIKKIAPNGATQTFTFAANSTATGNDPINASATVPANGQSDPIGLYIGTNNTVTETVPSGWALSSATCKTSSGASTGTLNVATVSGILIESGKVTTCEFTNLAKPALTVVKDNDADHDLAYNDTETVPSSASYPWTVTYKATISNASTSSSATITAISDNKVSGTLRSASTTDTDCADVIGTSIAGGASVTCYFDAPAFANANTSQVQNTLSVTATNSAGSDTKTDTSTVNFTPAPSIDLVKSATPNFSSPPKAGDKIDYSFTIKNTGNVTLTGVKLTDALVGLSGATCGSVTSLAPGASTTCTASYTLTQADINAGKVDNSATAKGTPPAGSDVSDTDGTSTPITRAASIELTKSATPSFSSPAKAGDTIDYSFTIKNTGNVTLGSVQLTDALVGLSNATCGGIGALSPGGSTTCTATYTLTQADINAGKVENSATAKGTPPSGSDVADTDGTTTPITGTPRIELTKTATPDFSSPPKAGDTIGYSFTIKNTGNVTLSSVQLSDALVAFNGATCGSVTSLTPGASTTCTASYTLKQSDIDAGKVDNEATAKGTAPAGDDVTDKDGTSTPITRAASIALTKSATPDFSSPPKAGDEIDYSFKLENTGNVTLTGVELTDALVAFNGATCEKTSLAPGETATCTASYTLKQSDVNAGKVDNEATAKGTPPAGDDVTDKDGTTTPITRAPKIDLTKSATPKFGADNTAQAGEKVEYSFLIENTGNVTLTGVQLSDALVSLNGATCGSVTSLAPGASTTCTATYTLTQADIDAGKVDNEATAKGTPPAGDDVTDKDAATVPLDEAPLVVLVKAATPDFGADGVPQSGEKISYKFTITNTGNVTLTSVDLTDALVGYTDATCEKTSLAPGEIATCTASYPLTQGDIDAGKVDNKATACGLSPTSSEVCDEATTSTTLTAAPKIDLTKSATPQFGADITAQAGEKVEYSFLIENTGNVTLTGVQLTDALVGLSGATCEKTSLAPGETATCTASYTLKQSDIDAGKVDNEATAKGTPPTGDDVTDKDAASVPLDEAPLVVLVKAATPDFGADGVPQAGEKISYKFTITNTGNVTLTSVDLTDALVGYTDATCEKTSLAPGEIATCTASYTLTQADIDAGKVDNKATACGLSPTSSEVCDEATTSTTLTAAPKIDLTKSATPQFGTDDTAQAGEKIDYSFTIENTGNVTLTGVQLTDALVSLSGATCEKTSLAPGETATCTASYTLKQSDIDAGKVDNEATAKGTPPTGDDVTDKDGTSTPITRAPKIDLTKSATPKFGADNTAQAGEKIDYSFLIENTGNVSLSGVQLTDALVSLNGATCEKTSLAPGETATCTASYTLKQSDIDAGKVDNEATAKGTPPAGDDVTDKDSASVPLASGPSIDLTKSATPQFGADNTAQAGEKVEYSFLIENTGNVTLTGVQLTDALVGLSGATCEKTSLAPGETATCTASYTLKQSDIDAGKVDNEATAKGTPPTGDDVTDKDAATVPLDEAPLVVLVKAATPDFGADGIPQAGEKISYKFTITNTGNVTLSGVDLDDSLLGYTDKECEKSTLAPGESATCTASYTLTQGDVDAGKVTNKATACGLSPTSSEVCDDDTTTTTLTAAPKIDLTKSATPQFGADNTAQAGEKIEYSFLIENTGNVTLTGVQLTDALVSLNGATCEKTSLAPGETATCTASYTLKQSDIDAGKVDNEATAKGTPPAGDDVTDKDSASVPLASGPSIDLTKSATPNFSSPPKAGDKIDYSFTIKNSGNVTLTGVQLTDALVAFNGATCEKTSLAPSESATCTASYTLKQSDIDAGKVDNEATAKGTPPTGDDVTDKDGTTTPITRAPKIDLTKSATPKFGADNTAQAGEKIEYSFLIENTGNVTLSSVQLTDALVSLSGATCEKTSLAPGETATCTASYTLKQSDIDAGKVDNEATAKGTPPAGDDVTDKDAATVPLDEAPLVVLVKAATPDFGADGVPQAGEKVSYKFTITNTGNVTLSGVDLTDALVGYSDATCEKTSLAPGETATCMANYTLTQGDIDAGKVTNKATACGLSPTSGEVCDEDTTTTTLTAAAKIDLTKSATPSFSSPPKAGDKIDYSFTIKNTGNVTLSSVQLTDALVALNGATCGGSSSLAPGASTTCTASYTLKQSDIDAGKVTNEATAKGTPPTGADVTDKDGTTTSITGGAALQLTKQASPATYSAAGQVITYTYGLKNTGNVTLTGPFVVTDDKITGPVTCGTSSSTLAPGATFGGTCTANYTIQSGDLNATGTGSVTNKATATAKDPQGSTVTSNQATATVNQIVIEKVARITPTQTTCATFADGTSPDLNTLSYNVQRNKVNNVAPGVMFYYVKITAPSSSFTIGVPQSNDGGWKLMPIQDVGQIVLYNSNCTKSASQGTTRFDNRTGLSTIQVGAATTGAVYYVGIKYSPSGLSGQAVKAPFPTVTYSFSTTLDGTAVGGSQDSITVVPK